MKEKDQVFNEKSKLKTTKKSNKWIFIIGGIAAILAVLIIIYQVFFNSPKNIFLRAINDEYQKLNNQISELSNNEIYRKSKKQAIANQYKFNIDMNVDDSLISGSGYDKIIDQINQLDLEINSNIDRKNKKMNYEFLLNQKNNSLLEVDLYAKEKSFYLQLKDLLDKYIEIPVEEYDELFNTDQSIDDTKYLLKTFKDTVLNQLDKKDFTTNKVKTMINEKEIKTTKISYQLNIKKALVISKNTLKDLKSNSKFIKKMARVSGKTEDEIKKDIDASIKDIQIELKGVKEDDIPIEISIYTTGIFQTAVKYEISITSDKDEKIMLTYSDYQDIKKLDIKENSEQLLTLTSKKNSKNEYQTKAKIDTWELDVISKITNEKKTHQYKITENETNMSISGKIVSENKTVKKSKEYKGKINISLHFDISDQKDVFVLNLNETSNTKIGEKTTLPSLDHSISYKNLTEEEYSTIMNNITKNKNLMKFLETIINANNPAQTQSELYY